MDILILEESKRVSPPSSLALWQLGFRPFYLLASLFAAISIPLWAAQSVGWLRWTYLPGPIEHAHEMVFGFALAVVVGFLFTAGRNWSGQPTPFGWRLGLIALLWMAARASAYLPFVLLTALLNLAFTASSAWALGRALKAGDSRRNYFFVALLLAMGLASVLVQLRRGGFIDVPAWAGVHLALDIVLFIMAVMGGRVIPMFTSNGIPGVQARRHAGIERLALGSLLAVLACDLVGLRGISFGVLLAFAAVAHAWRLILWQPWRTLRTPLVWVLHLGYLWIVIHLILRAGAEWTWWSRSIAAHALAVGAIGGLAIGMMTRTSRGHTARPLQADKFDVARYLLIAGAAVVRVGCLLVEPTAFVPAVVGSALLWSAGFGLFAVRYWPVLTRARLDGKPG